MRETGISNLIRLEASRKGCRLWRNNNGACTTDTGSFIRYGLANESAAVNAVLKSADLIGIRPMIIEPWMVGGTFGMFLSREIKQPGWKYRDTARERAQVAWRDLINSLGGDAAIVTCEGSI